MSTIAKYCMYDFQKLYGFEPDMGQEGVHFSPGKCSDCHKERIVFWTDKDILPLVIRSSDSDWSLYDGDGPQVNPLETFQTFEEAQESANNLLKIWGALGRAFGYGVGEVSQGTTKLNSTQLEYWSKVEWENEDRNFISHQTYIVRPAIVLPDDNKI
jgi:hypothetical protein